MKLAELRIKNFRGYRDAVIKFDNLTALVGKNDAGKSTILEALDLFFNEGAGVVRFSSADINVQAVNDGEDYAQITAIFDDLPQKLTLDSSCSTDLASEYMLNAEGADGKLEIIKEFKATALNKPKVFINALHPGNLNCNNLLSLKISELRNKLQLADGSEIECSDKT